MVKIVKLPLEGRASRPTSSTQNFFAGQTDVQVWQKHRVVGGGELLLCLGGLEKAILGNEVKLKETGREIPLVHR